MKKQNKNSSTEKLESAFKFEPKARVAEAIHSSNEKSDFHKQQNDHGLDDIRATVARITAILSGKA